MTAPLFVLSVFGTEGNVNSVLAIAEALQRQKAEVVVLTHGVYRERYRDSGIEIVGLDDRDVVAAMDRSIHLLNAPRDVPRFFERYVIPFARAEALAITKLVDHRSAVLVTTDSPGLGARIAAEAASVPLVLLFQAPGFLLSRPLYAAMLTGNYGRRSRRSGTIAALRFPFHQ